jgi:hypothetical protein
VSQVTLSRNRSLGDRVALSRPCGRGSTLRAFPEGAVSRAVPAYSDPFDGNSGGNSAGRKFSQVTTS